METIHWLAAGLAALTVGVVSAGVCVFYFNRRIEELMRRLNKVEKARQTALAHGMQARTQVEMLQKELAGQHRSRTQVRSQQSRREALDLVLEAADRDAAAAASSQPHAGALPRSGFLDTQPI